MIKLDTLLLNQSQMLKEESLDQSALRHIIWFAVTQLYEVKLPPNSILPLFCIPIALIIVSGQSL